MRSTSDPVDWTKALCSALREPDCQQDRHVWQLAGLGTVHRDGDILAVVHERCRDCRAERKLALS